MVEEAGAEDRRQKTDVRSQMSEVRPPSSVLRRRGRQVLLQIVIGTIILICGIIIGSGAAVLRLKDQMVMRRGSFPPTRAVIEDMTARYDLTPEQAKKVETTFSKRRETLQSIFEEFRSKSEAEFKSLAADIQKILTPEQYARWEQDFKRRRRPGPPWQRGPGRPGERGFGRRGPGDRGPGRGFGDRGPGRDFRDRGPGRGFRDRQRGPREPNTPSPNAPEPNLPEPNAPSNP